MHDFFLRMARAMAWVGGAVLSALILVTCVSILGRGLNGLLHDIGTGWSAWLLGLGIGPVTGDFELVEAGMAFAIFAFLPLCQMTGGHASVDIFANKLSLAVNRVLRCLTEVVFAAVLILIAVQLAAGMQSKFRSGQTTFLIEFPIWWAYALCLVGAVFSAIVAVYIAAMRSAEMVTGRRHLPVEAGDTP
ncbi:MAG: TRAP transporter small permease [Pseudomonadota bacterium]